MSDLGKSNSDLLPGMLLGAVLVCTSALPTCAEQAASGDPTNTGEIHIEGEHITHLILKDSRGERKAFADPGSCVVLPAGTYDLERIILEGGHYYLPDQVSPDSRLTVDANAPATLELGAPLRQVVKIEREGSTMVLNYRLIGRGGERYTINETEDSPAPSFAVYRGDRKVASGDFEFG